MKRGQVISLMEAAFRQPSRDVKSACLRVDEALVVSFGVTNARVVWCDRGAFVVFSSVYVAFDMWSKASKLSPLMPPDP